MTQQVSDAQISDKPIGVCYNHITRETMLRCNRCDRPMCTECAVLTPTGYRCKECVKGQQKVFDTAEWYDYPLAIFVAAFLSYLGSFIASYLGFFTIFIGPVAGTITAEAVRWVVRKRRSKTLFQMAVAGAVVGALPVLGMALLSFFSYGVGGLLGLVWPAVYVFLVTSTMYYRLVGIRIR